MELCSGAGAQSPVVQHLGQRIPAGSFVNHLVKQFPYPSSFFLIDDQIHDRLISLVPSALIHQLVAIAYKTTCIVAAGHDLSDSIAGSDGCFLRLPCRLPKADVVHQLIAVCLNFLLALMGTPHLNSMLDEPFQHKGSFAFDSSKTVKHIDQQNVKFTIGGFFFQLLDGIAF